MSCFTEQIQVLFAECEHWRHREKMHHYQHDAVEFLKLNPFSALFIDLGLGKSIVSLTCILDLIGSFDIDCALVIAPLRVANKTWPDEIKLWHHTAGLSYAHIRDEDVVTYVNEAGAEARQLMKDHDISHPEVRKLVHKMRLNDVKRKLKNAGLDLRKSRQRIEQEFEKVRDLSLTTKERKEFVGFARKVAAWRVVRDHKKRNPASIYIINREQVEFLVEAWGTDWPYDTVFIDESSSLKDHTTKRFKALAKVRPFIKRMHQLTATPAAETYLHLFAQIYLLDLGERLGKSFTAFADEYFDKNKYNFTYKLKAGAEEKIAAKISDICLTMKREDYLEFQEPIPVVHKVKLSVEQMQQYRTMEDESVLELPDGSEVEAETAAALSQKLLQMASGVLYETRWIEDPIDEERYKRRVVHHLHDHKIEMLRQLQEEACGAPLLVGYHHKASLERLLEAFPEAKTLDDAGHVQEAWNKGKVPMLLLHPQSGGHGLNLQHGGHNVVWFDLPWSLELYSQFNGRLDRQGQLNAVVIHHLVAAGTIDEVVLECLLNKRDAQEQLFRLLKNIRARVSRKNLPQLEAAL